MPLRSLLEVEIDALLAFAHFLEEIIAVLSREFRLKIVDTHLLPLFLRANANVTTAGRDRVIAIVVAAGCLPLAG